MTKGMYTVKVTEQHATGTYRETIQANDDNHVALIRETSRACARPGSTQTIKVTKN